MYVCVYLQFAKKYQHPNVLSVVTSVKVSDLSIMYMRSGSLFVGSSEYVASIQCCTCFVLLDCYVVGKSMEPHMAAVICQQRLGTRKTCAHAHVHI